MACGGDRREAELNGSAAGPLLTLAGMTKRYPGCLANDQVSLTIERNQIHALLGENGAGKSTLVKIIYGVTKPDRGTMVWDGREVAVQSPGHAQSLGIGMVFQHFSLFEAMTVLENVAHRPAGTRPGSSAKLARPHRADLERAPTVFCSTPIACRP